MKALSLLAAALIAAPAYTFAADAVKVNISMGEIFYQTISLAGPNASVTLTPSKIPNTTLELKLLAPEPIVIQFKETTVTAGVSSEVIGKIALPQQGNSVTVTELKGSKFHHPYVVTRPE
jgi:hypothetical protein